MDPEKTEQLSQHLAQIAHELSPDNDAGGPIMDNLKIMLANLIQQMGPTIMQLLFNLLTHTPVVKPTDTK